MKSLIYSGGIALVLASVAVSGAEAQKKMSYEQAFAQCKQEVGGGPLGGEGLNTSSRYAAAGSCMKRYGFRLKKKSKA
jgi:hypothetical protein